MQNRVPVPRAARDLPDFDPVPRQRNRHDGWTPERQKAFIEALADTGSVRRAANMVNMAQANAYALRRAAGAEGFRRAWDAALDFGLARLKDEAFTRAIEGELIPVFDRGKLMGFRRKRNDALLMFCLRHYGQDANGKRTTINYFSARAAAGTGEGGAGAAASTTTVRTVITGDGAGDSMALIFHGLGLQPGAREFFNTIHQMQTRGPRVSPRALLPLEYRPLRRERALERRSRLPPRDVRHQSRLLG